MTEHYERMGIRSLELLIEKYIQDAAKLAEGEPVHRLSCYLDSIETPAALSAAIKACGAAYLERMKAIRNAAPTVYGKTISIYQPQEIAPNTPSIEDQKFLGQCRRQLRKQGFVLAADADTYEEIAKAYPGHVFPARVRGAEAKRFLSLCADDAVTKAISKRRGRK